MQLEHQKKDSSISKVIILNIFFLFLLVVFILLGTEIYLRLTIPSSSGGSIFEYTQDTKRYKVMKKNASTMPWGEELRTNNLGFRDNKDTIPVKEPGEYRVIVLGDSFTVSAGVKYESIYTTLLEKKLAEEAGNVKVINLAVGGYNIVQYEMVLNEVALELQPDLILVALFPTNDFSMETYENNRLRAMGKPKAPESPWYKEAYVYRAFLWRVVTKLSVIFPPKDNIAKVEKVDPELGWTENLSALERIIQTTRENKVEIAVASLPNSWTYESQRQDSDRVDAFLAEKDIPYLILLNSFIDSGVKETELRVNRLDSHPNEKYHELVTEFLTPFLAPFIELESQ